MVLVRNAEDTNSKGTCAQISHLKPHKPEPTSAHNVIALSHTVAATITIRHLLTESFASSTYYRPESQEAKACW